MKTVGKSKCPEYEVRALIVWDGQKPDEITSMPLPYTLREGEHFGDYGVYQNIPVSEDLKGNESFTQCWIADFQNQDHAEKFCVLMNNLED